MSDRWSTWQAEQAGTNHGPSGAAVVRLALVVVLVALVLQAVSAADGGQVSPIGDSQDRGSLCDEHPHWSVCKEPPRGR